MNVIETTITHYQNLIAWLRLFNAGLYNINGIYE
jgi:hypothetical protein